MTKFEPGKTYTTRSIGDHNCIISETIASRTDKTVVTVSGKRFRLFEYNGTECFRPWGKFSMAPTLRATQATD